MGKDRKHQRSKEGVKPSSSSKAAELLAGSSLSQLTTTELGKLSISNKDQHGSLMLTSLLMRGSESPGLTPSANNPLGSASTASIVLMIDDAEDLSPELKVCLKKLVKKDATTKCKALAELLSHEDIFVANDDDSDTELKSSKKLKSFMKIWSPLFQKLSFDDSRKARELTLTINGRISKLLGRNVAPYLKGLIPHWYLSHFDTHVPVSSLATQTFQEVFPTEQKRRNALHFAYNEIVDIIKKTFVLSLKPPENQNIVSPALQTSKKKKGSEKSSPQVLLNSESEDIKLRLLHSSIRALNSLLNLDLSNEEMKSFVNDEKGAFWSFVSSIEEQDILVRKPLYECAAKILEKKVWDATTMSKPCIELLEKGTKETKDCMPVVWNYFLCLALNDEILKNNESFWEIMMSQLISCAEAAFHNLASLIAPSYLPLVDRISSHLLSSGKQDELSDFYFNLVTSYSNGFTDECSGLERKFILQAYAETLAYIFKSGDDAIIQRVQEPFSTFVNLNLKELKHQKSFPSSLGRMIKSKKFCSLFPSAIFQDSYTYADFIIEFCEEKGFSKRGGTKVNFSDELAAENLENPPTTTAQKVELKKEKIEMLDNIVSHCINFKAYKCLSKLLPFLIASNCSLNSFGKLDPSNIDLAKEEDLDARLHLILSLMQVHPENPSMLSTFSDEFTTHCSEGPRFLSFVREISPQLRNMVPLQRWVQSSLEFKKKLLESLKSSDEEDVFFVLLTKLLLQNLDIFEQKTNIKQKILSILAERIESDEQSKICKKLAKWILRSEYKFLEAIHINFEGLFIKFWKILAMCQDPSELSPLDEVTIRFFKSYPDKIIEVLYVPLEDSDYNVPTSSLSKYSKVIMQISTENADIRSKIYSEIISFNAELCSKVCQKSRTQQDLLALLGIGFQFSVNQNKFVPKYLESFAKMSVVKTCFHTELFVNDANQLENRVLSGHLVSLAYCLSFVKVCRSLSKIGVFEIDFWREWEKNIADVADKYLKKLSVEYVSCWKQDLNNLWCSCNDANNEPLLTSLLPIRILQRKCLKLKIPLKFELYIGSGIDELFNWEGVDCEENLNKILKRISWDKSVVVEVLRRLLEKRDSSSSVFEFETMWAHSSNHKVLTKLVQLTFVLLKSVNWTEMADASEILSKLSCWVAAWAKNSKTLQFKAMEAVLCQNIWISTLTKCICELESICSKRQGEEEFKSFCSEYAEFHSFRLYPPVYSWYTQLYENLSAAVRGKVDNVSGVDRGNEESEDNWIWIVEPFLWCSKVLSTAGMIPAMRSIQLDLNILCEQLVPIMVMEVKDPKFAQVCRICKLSAFSILGKMKVVLEEDFPIVPPIFDQAFHRCFYKIQKLKEHGGVVNFDELCLSYLLCWNVLLWLQRDSIQFASYVRDQDHLLKPLLDVLFLPIDAEFPDICELRLLPTTLDSSLAQYFNKDYATKPHHMDPEEVEEVNLTQLACQTIYRCLHVLPYTVRWWWNNHVSKQRDRVFIERFITKFLSAQLAAQEISRVKKIDELDGNDSNITVQSHVGSNELVAHYKIEETRVTLNITLPLNHPLGPVAVKVNDKKLHSTISNLLNSQSHSLSSGLKVWKENLDNMYKDVDECAICFFIMHHSTKQLPKLACKTCRKLFHAACLYKWFSTSNKSECPLCRNLF